MRRILVVAILCMSVFLFSCEPEREEPCSIHPLEACTTFTFSLVNADTYENLMGIKGQLIHPDSLVITNSRGDTMHHDIRALSNGWYTVENFSVFQELNCFNQCLLDSTFTRTYFVYIGGGDTDTMQVHFPAHSENAITYYNGLNGKVPDDRPDSTGLGHTTYWFRKKL